VAFLGESMMADTLAPSNFFVEIIKPSHYDDDGHVIQWLRAFIPSNSLACLHGLVHDSRAGKGDAVHFHSTDRIYSLSRRQTYRCV
jgi:hypothetical protein